MEGKMLEMFEVGPCEDGFQLGFLTGQRFRNQIRSRLAGDHIFQSQLLPFAQTPQAQQLIKALSETNQNMFPRYWAELLGIAEGSAVPVLDIILINFRKELVPFISNTEINSNANTADDCSDVLIVSDSMAVAAHNEDAVSGLIGNTYLIKVKLSNGLSFTAYTYAGELPTCAFGFNSQGVAFTQNSVLPIEGDIVPGGIGRSFVSRDLLEATSIADALARLRSFLVSLGHSYNLIDVQKRMVLNVETASRLRVSVHEVGSTPFFHANMYLHLQVQQVHDESSVRRQKRAAVLPQGSKADVLSVLRDTEDPKEPIYSTGPHRYTLCTTFIDLDEKTLTIFEGHPKKGNISYVFSMSSNDFNCKLVNSEDQRTRL